MRTSLRSRSRRLPRAVRGFTYVELLVVLALLAILALVAQPYVHHKMRQKQEIELKRTLRMMRDAIDRYHEYAVQGLVEPWDPDWNFYPEDLEMLVEGVEVVPGADQDPVTLTFLRKIPIDPTTGVADWSCRGYEDDPEERASSCEDIYDVFSTSSEIALDGSYYEDW